jgi:lysine biosynthesis protein LysW
MNYLGKEMKEAKCPLCGERIKVGVKPWVGQAIECPACDANLEVVGLNPFSLDWPYDDSGYLSYDYDEEESEINQY